MGPLVGRQQCPTAAPNGLRQLFAIETREHAGIDLVLTCRSATIALMSPWPSHRGPADILQGSGVLPDVEGEFASDL
jgi:hypothetical protein